jgi:hypothetical protein
LVTCFEPRSQATVSYRPAFGLAPEKRVGDPFSGSLAWPALGLHPITSSSDLRLLLAGGNLLLLVGSVPYSFCVGGGSPARPRHSSSSTAADPAMATMEAQPESGAVAAVEDLSLPPQQIRPDAT